MDDICLLTSNRSACGSNDSMDMDTFGHLNTDARYGECSADLLTCQIQRYLFLVMSPVLILIATVGNALALAVMCRRNLRGTPTAVFIASLAVSDTVVVWTALTRHFIKKYNEYDIRQYSEWACRFQRFFLYVSLDTSAWILTAVAIERFLAVCLPQRHRLLKSTSRPWQVVSVIVLVMVAFNMNVFFNYGKYTKTDGNVTETFNCGFRTPEARAYLTKYHLWIAFAIYSVLPFTTMLILNIFIIRKLRSMQKLLQSRKLASTKSTRGQKNTISLTRMLLCVTFYFVIVTTPAFIFSIIQEYMFDDDNYTEEKHANYELVDAISTLVLYMNHSINFLLYCVSGKRFRKEVRKLCCLVKSLTTGSTTVDPTPLMKESSIAQNQI